MYPSNGDANGNAEIEQQSNAANPNAKASASNGPALLVIDDNSNSEDASVLVIANHNPSTSSLTNTSKTSTSSNPPAAPLPPPPSSSSSTSTSHHNFISTKEKTNLDLKNDTPEQQRRRNSSIAKLLGGQPLNNQQYSEIHQQILEDQSAQNQSHNSENGIQRSRSSITRTLLMNNTEKASKPSSKPVAPSTPAFAKGVEYLLHQELDSDHASTAISRNGSSPSVFQNLNLSNTNNGQIPSASRFKRKRSIPKLLAPMNLNKTSMNIPPFALHNPIELDNSSTDGSTTSASTSHTTTTNGNSNIPSLNRSHREPIDALRFTPSTHSAFSNPGHFSGLALPNSSSAAVAAAFSYSKSNLNSSLYNQFSIHPDRLTGGNHRSFSFHYPHYPSPMKLSFQTPILPLSSGAMPTLDDTDVTANSTKRIKSMLFGTDAFEPPRKRSYSNLSNPTSASAADSYVPLKKRLLHAYQNEQDSTPTL